jgi:dienelactone hydrolase
MLGGSRVRQHWDLADRMNPAKQSLIAGDVDVLTMSHNWLVPDDGIELFTDLGLEHNPKLRALVQISWPAFDHWEPIGNPALWDPAKKINHNQERDARSLDGLRAANASVKPVIEKQIAALNAKYGHDVIRIVPVGDAVLRLRERVAAGMVPGIKRQSELFTDPIGHAKAPVMALATYCNFACIYGRSPVGLDDGDRELDRIDPKLRSVLQEIAWDAVTSHPMSGVTKDGRAREGLAKASLAKEGPVRRPEPAQGQIVPAPELPASLPWDLAALSQPPAFEWLDETSPVRSLLYAGEPFEGHATRVFAYYATPATIGGGGDAGQAAATTTKGPWPGIVLVHGGGGTAFAEWVTLWSKRGYAAIAMDLAGSRPDPAGTKRNAVVRLPHGGPGQEHKDKFDTIGTPETSDDWPYHAVANVILAHSLLRSLPGVDASRTALTGISWGGYTTCLVASLDNRFRAAVPVYGCGHLRDNSCWLGDFARIGPEQSALWSQRYDPASYLPACRVPIFFVNGTNDFAYPLDSHMKSHADVEHAAKNVRIQVNMPHGHEAGWAPPEIAAFVDAALLGTPGLPVVDTPTVDDRGTRGRVTAGGPVATASLVVTVEPGPINKLTWQTLPAEVGVDGTLSAPKPPADTRAYFFTATTPAGLQVSSPVVMVPGR